MDTIERLEKPQINVILEAGAVYEPIGAQYAVSDERFEKEGLNYFLDGLAAVATVQGATVMAGLRLLRKSRTDTLKGVAKNLTESFKVEETPNLKNANLTWQVRTAVDSLDLAHEVQAMSSQANIIFVARGKRVGESLLAIAYKEAMRVTERKKIDDQADSATSDLSQGILFGHRIILLTASGTRSVSDADAILGEATMKGVGKRYHTRGSIWHGSGGTSGSIGRYCEDLSGLDLTVAPMNKFNRMAASAISELLKKNLPGDRA